MKTPIGLLLFIFLALVLIPCAIPQVPQDHTVPLNAVVQKTPPKITLNWAVDATASAIQVCRRTYGASTWGSPVSISSPSTATNYADTNVTVGQVYEYKVVK